jgi:hypothetical protein
MFLSAFFYITSAAEKNSPLFSHNFWKSPEVSLIKIQQAEINKNVFLGACTADL